MCQISVYDFVVDSLAAGLAVELRGKRILEVGSRSVNGGVRPVITLACQPSEYLGIDIIEGKGVDRVLPCDRLLTTFGEGSFDAVVATEVLEHVDDWKTALRNMKGVLKPGGLALVTVPSKGFPFHAWPYDFWRYQIEDVQQAFSDFDVLHLRKNPESPGVLFAGRKSSRPATDLAPIALYSMILGRRTPVVQRFDQMPAGRRLMVTTSNRARAATRTLLRRLPGFSA